MAQGSEVARNGKARPVAIAMAVARLFDANERSVHALQLLWRQARTEVSRLQREFRAVGGGAQRVRRLLLAEGALVGIASVSSPYGI